MEYLKLEDLQKLLKNHYADVRSYKVDRLTPEGENFLSLMLKVEAKCTKNGFLSKEEILSLVAKVSSSDILQSGPFNERALFGKEIQWYATVLPLLKEFSKAYEVEDFMDIFPKYYNGWIPKDGDESQRWSVFLLEFLKDYTNYDRRIGFDFETSKVILKNIARFQSLTFALKLKKPALFKEKVLPIVTTNTMSENVPEFPEPQNTANQPPSLEDLFDSIADRFVDHKIISRAKECLMNEKKNMINRPEIREKWAVVTHNDFWTNNIMIKKVGSKANQVKIVDFQMLDYGSIAADLLFFLLSSVKNSVLQTQLLDELIRYHYDQLISNLKQFEIKTDQYSYEEFLKELEIASKELQFGHAVFMMFFIFGKKAEDKDDNRELVTNLGHVGITEAHKERICIVTDVCARRNWI